MKSYCKDSSNRWERQINWMFFDIIDCLAKARLRIDNSTMWTPTFTMERGATVTAYIACSRMAIVPVQGKNKVNDQ